MVRQHGISLLLIAAFTWFCGWRFAGTPSPDLMASWLAGHFYALGELDQIYPADTVVFTMLPPSDWWPYLQSIGYERAVFPFIYPPIWAAFFSKLTQVTSFEVVQVLASVLNPLLMGLSILLAGRMARRHLSLVAFTALGLAIMLLTLPGWVALEQDQPQILVAFLMILAFERDQAKKPLTAGAALALAASIKLYPVLFVFMWLAARRWRSVASFGCFGLALGLLSIAVAGWPLHAVYLHQVSLIKNSLMVTNFTYAIEPFIANLYLQGQMTFIPALDNIDPENKLLGWNVIAKSPTAAWASTFAMLAVVAFVSLRMGRSKWPAPLLWPASIIALALVSPLSWGYHYLPALAFAPALAGYLGSRRGLVVLVIILAPIATLALVPLKNATDGHSLPQLLGTLSMLALGIAFAYARARPYCRIRPKSSDNAKSNQNTGHEGLHTGPASI